jgi:hypothetical protein
VFESGSRFVVPVIISHPQPGLHAALLVMNTGGAIPARHR